MGLADMLSAILSMFKRSPPVPVEPRGGAPSLAGGTSVVSTVPSNVPQAPSARTFSLTSELLADGVDITQARALPWVQPLNDAMARYMIDTPARAAAFVAQLAHESVKFSYTKEIWGPTADQRAYEPPGAKAAELGNTQPGDGLRFCGRGLIQITGRANYQACGDGLGLDLIGTPALLEQPEHAAASAGWFWNAHGLNTFADSGDFVTLTKRINGGTNGLADRQALWATCKSFFGA